MTYWRLLKGVDEVSAAFRLAKPGAIVTQGTGRIQPLGLRLLGTTGD